MNMDEWNLRMRAQKEQERKKKTESAEILRGYRGGDVDEEARKLAALKLEDRRKHEEAERILREYRETHVEERERRQRKDQGAVLPPIVVKQQDSIEFESVAAKAAQFNSPGKAPSFESPRKISSFRIQPSASDAAEKEEKGNDYEDVPRELPFPFDPASEAAQVDPGATNPSTAPSAFEEGGGKGDVDGEEDYDEADDTDEKKDEVSDPALVSPGDPPLLHHPTVVRLDVNFSFGLITTSEKPLLDTYMLAVEEVVRNTLKERTHLSQRVTYNPTFCPFVQDCSNDGTSLAQFLSANLLHTNLTLPLPERRIADHYVDAEGRANVRRVLVTASVPVFLSNGVSISVARDAVVSGLQQAIHSGKFLELALGTGAE